MRTARVLLDAGASANTGFFEKNHQPEPEFESAIYGAAGIAHHPELTKLLLESGADPNDNETPYHVIETYDNRAMEVLVDSGKLTADSMSTLLLRKHDWHDYDGISTSSNMAPARTGSLAGNAQRSFRPSSATTGSKSLSCRSIMAPIPRSARRRGRRPRSPHGGVAATRSISSRSEAFVWRSRASTA